MLGVFSALEVAASGLSAERIRMNTIASNLANARTTQVEGGGPYRRLDPVFQAIPLDREQGVVGADPGVSLVKVQRIQADERPGMMVYEPGHPDANAAGYVEYPNVNAVEEMVNMITASRAYEAGVTSIESVKAMARSAIGIGRGV
jgi:flagellar basal-body rod protein FlgC